MKYLFFFRYYDKKRAPESKKRTCKYCKQQIGFSARTAKAYLRLRRSKDHSDYADFCIKLLSLNGTIVNIEKSFKPVRYIHNKLRTRLKPSLVRMLVLNYYNIRSIEKYNGKLLID